MFAMLIDKNKNLIWSEVPDIEIKPEEVLIEVHSAALNRADFITGQNIIVDGGRTLGMKGDS